MRDLTDAELLELTGGYWHKEISRTEGDAWEKCQQLLETVPASISIDHDGNLVKSDWAAKETADVQYTNATRYAQTLRGTVAQKGGIVNRNLVTVQHTFKRRKLRTIGCSWSHPNRLNVDAYIEHMWALPTKEAINSALDGSGWESRGVSFQPPWHTYHVGGVYRYIDYSGIISEGGIVIDFSEDVVIAFTAGLMKTWDQTHINDYVFDVKSNTSIAALGERAVEENWGISEEAEEEIQEAVTTHGLSSVAGKGSQPKGTVVAYGGLSIENTELEYGQELSNGDWYVDDINAATDLDGAILTAINRATTEILATHRDHSELFEVPFSHENTLEKTTRLVGDVTCKGKNRSLVHSINPVAG
ncbi:MAG: hypothetical protein GY942_15160, partial [Aestuariibacter sp.]|nr:hypothetical protein [Aestuariibacter sp.]